jgi:hypothetical protein
MTDGDDPIPGLAESAKFMTLSAQVCKSDVERVTRIIKRETDQGRSPSLLLAELKKSLPDYDDHSRALLMKLGVGAPLTDDFPDSIVESSVAVKANTLELALKSPPADVSLFSLVYHKNTLWLISEFQGNRCVLKQL